MTREKIDNARARLVDAQTKKFFKEQNELLRTLLKELGLSDSVPTPINDNDTNICYIQRINTHLQTEMMRNICESAEKSCKFAEDSCKSAAESSKLSKWSCRWAAIAAITSAVGAIASLACAIIAAMSIYGGNS